MVAATHEYRVALLFSSFTRSAPGALALRNDPPLARPPRPPLPRPPPTLPGVKGAPPPNPPGGPMPARPKPPPNPPRPKAPPPGPAGPPPENAAVTAGPAEGNAPPCGVNTVSMV